MKKLEVNPRLADVLLNLRKSAVEFEKIVNEIEKKRLVSHNSTLEKFISSMGECTEAVCSVIGSEIEQSLYELIPEKE